MAGVRRRILLRATAFCAGLVPFALLGLATAAWGALRRSPYSTRSRTLPRLLVAPALWFAGLLFHGVVAVSQFTGYEYRVRQLRCPRRVRPGQEFDVEVSLENIGGATWDARGGAHPVRLGTWDPPDHPSPFHDPGTWLDESRAAELTEAVPPGATATFRMTFRAPLTPGRHRDNFDAVAEHLYWLPPRGISVEIEVAP